MQAYCVSKTEWTLVEWMACGSRLCCCTAPTYITHFIGFVAFSPSLAHFSHITSIKWDLVFLSYNLLSLPLCHSLSLFPIYISLSLSKGFQMKFSICRSLSFSFTARLCRQPDHTEIKNTKCFFLSFTTSIHSPSTIYSAPFFNFHIFILISETLYVTVPPPALPHLYGHLTRYLLILFISSRSILITLLSIIYLFLKIQKSEVFLPELWDLCLIWFWLTDVCFYSLLLQYLIIFR